MKKILLIYNPKAGKNSRRKSAERLAELLKENGGEVDVYVTKRRGDATERAKTASGYDVLAVAGGDGTLNEVLSGALSAGYKPTVLYIPSGTTNQTAIAFGLPVKAEETVRLLKEGETKDFDMGRFDDNVFVDVCSFGYGTESSLTTSQKWKNKFGFKAFYFNQVKYLFNIKPLKLKITCDGKVTEGEYVFGNLLNADMISTFVRLNDLGVAMDDGYLDLVLVKKIKNFLYLPGTFVKLMKKRFDGERITLLHGKNFTLEFEGKQPFLLDGERKNAENVATVRVLPHAFGLYVPKPKEKKTGK